MMELLLAEAFKIAVEVHGNQRDKAGEPYMGHICRVMSAMDTDTERCVAILHDSIEDSKRVGGMTRHLRGLFPDEIVDAVGALSRRPVNLQTLAQLVTDGARPIERESYMDYIRRLSSNPLAVKVKLADLRDNMNEDRLRKLPTKEEAFRLHKKYWEAYRFLSPTATESFIATLDNSPIIQTTEEISFEEAKERFKL